MTKNINENWLYSGHDIAIFRIIRKLKRNKKKKTPFLSITWSLLLILYTISWFRDEKKKEIVIKTHFSFWIQMAGRHFLIEKKFTVPSFRSFYSFWSLVTQTFWNAIEFNCRMKKDKQKPLGKKNENYLIYERGYKPNRFCVCRYKTVSAEWVQAHMGSGCGHMKSAIK